MKREADTEIIKLISKKELADTKKRTYGEQTIRNGWGWAEERRCRERIVRERE